MSTLDLAIQIQHLDQRLVQVEDTLLRLERLLTNLVVAQSSEPPPTQMQLPRTVRLVSPRLRHRKQARDFVMVVTRDSTDASL